MTDFEKHIHAFQTRNPNLLHGSRLAHSIGVAKFLYAYGLTHNYTAKDTQDLYLMGLLHDIDYLDNPKQVLIECEDGNTYTHHDIK